LLFYLLTTEPTNHFPKEVRKVSQNIVRFEQSQKKARAPIALGKKMRRGAAFGCFEDAKKNSNICIIGGIFLPLSILFLLLHWLGRY
jgi:hypothetical protein